MPTKRLGGGQCPPYLKSLPMTNNTTQRDSINLSQNRAEMLEKWRLSETRLANQPG
ncbi:hypothetical protein [Scytonema sp. NUACC26]|uniref:hypothetical protein n=1 Tax=Scytonema sp. NUACC26 TaxID=3140176 RepID=UPI0034DB9182